MGIVVAIICSYSTSVSVLPVSVEVTREAVAPA